MDYMMIIMITPRQAPEGHSLGGPAMPLLRPCTGDKEESMFFFEKKNQKTFPRWPGQTMPNGESLFASFSSEKEESFLD
jgi:hypothetical protein